MLGVKESNFYPILIFLSGEIGDGKTTLCKGVLKGLVYKGMVKSRTYNLVETYELSNLVVFHFDFYQISHQKELSNVGIQEYLDTNNSISIIEWPEKMASFLPNPDIQIIIHHSEKKEDQRSLEIKSNVSIKL